MRANPDLRLGPFRIPPKLRARLHSRRLTPFVVWAIVLVMAIALNHRQVGRVSVTGFAEETRTSVAPLASGRLERLEVALNQDVVRGQIVALLNDQEPLLQLREARVELERLTSNLGREEALWKLDVAEQQVDQQTNLRQFARDAESAHLEYLDALAELAERRIELQGLELTLERTRKLEEDDLTSRAALDEDQVAYQALRDWATQQELRVDSMLVAYRDADARYQEFLNHYVIETPGTDLLLKPLENAIEVQEVRIERLNLAILQRVLRSPADGRVVEIFCRDGEVVAAGQPVVSILAPRSTELVAYLPEDQILEVQPGAQVRIRRAADPRQVFDSSVTCLGSMVVQLPARLNPAAMSPSWGIPVFISLPESPPVRPGEAFEVFF